MLKSVLCASALSLSLTLGGCADDATKNTTLQVQPAQQSLITGQLTYRERIALRGKHVMTVTLSDVSIADRKAPILSTFTKALTDEQIPLPFTLAIDPAKLKKRDRYSVLGTLADSTGELIWTTDTVHLIDTSKSDQDLGNLNMVRVQRKALSGDTTTMANKMITYQCDKGMVKAKFSDKSVSMSVNNDQYELPSVISASGAKYERINESGRVMFWEKGEQATVEVNGKSYLNCTKVLEKFVPTPLTGRRWVVKDMTGSTLPSDTELTLNFTTDGRTSGNAGCNRFTGGYDIESQKVTFGPLGMTRKMCPPEIMDVEQTFTDILNSGGLLKIGENRTLTITDSKGRVIRAR